MIILSLKKELLEEYELFTNQEYIHFIWRQATG